MAKTWRLYSWNVNGVRAIHKKGFMDWIQTEKPGVLGLQEIKISADQLTPQLTDLDGYSSYWNHAQRKGYSGTAIFTQDTPELTVNGLGIEEFDSEGRVLQADFGDFIYMTIYYPNGKKDETRLDYKMRFYDAFLDMANRLVKEEGREIVVCGDFNTAHKEIDLARPKENRKVSGFLPIECEWMDKFVDNGYVDTFRYFNPELAEQYTWWDQVTRARERNVGWRIDYFFVSQGLVKNLKAAKIHADVMGSDHCPVSIELEI